MVAANGLRGALGACRCSTTNNTGSNRSAVEANSGDYVLNRGEDRCQKECAGWRVRFVDGAATLHLLNVTLGCPISAAGDTACGGCAINNAARAKRSGQSTKEACGASLRRNGACNDGEGDEGSDDEESEFGEHF